MRETENFLRSQELSHRNKRGLEKAMARAKKARLAERRALTTNTTESTKFMNLIDETLEIIFKNEDDNAFKKLRENYSDDFTIESLRKDILRMSDEIVESIEGFNCETTLNMYVLNILNRNNMSREVRYCINFWYAYSYPNFDRQMGNVYEIIMDFNDMRNLYRKTIKNRQIA